MKISSTTVIRILQVLVCVGILIFAGIVGAIVDRCVVNAKLEALIVKLQSK